MQISVNVSTDLEHITGSFVFDEKVEKIASIMFETIGHKIASKVVSQKSSYLHKRYPKWFEWVFPMRLLFYTLGGGHLYGDD